MIANTKLIYLNTPSSMVTNGTYLSVLYLLYPTLPYPTQVPSIWYIFQFYSYYWMEYQTDCWSFNALVMLEVNEIPTSIVYKVTLVTLQIMLLMMISRYIHFFGYKFRTNIGKHMCNLINQFVICCLKFMLTFLWTKVNFFCVVEHFFPPNFIWWRPYL